MKIFEIWPKFKNVDKGEYWRRQSDLIGLFLKCFGDKLSYKSIKISKRLARSVKELHVSANL